MKIVTAYTFKGKFLTRLLRTALRPVHFLKKIPWSSPPPGFHDDPLRFNFKDLIYFAYKYYLRPPLKDDRQGAVRRYFEQNAPDFTPPEEFLELRKIKLTAAGDLMPYEWIQPDYCRKIWEDVADDFFQTDIAIANLETPVDLRRAPSHVPEMMLTDMRFNGDGEMFDIFNGAGRGRFNVLSFANNHTLDQGVEGVIATLQFLEEKKIVQTGAARNERERQNFPVIEKEGIRIAFIAYTYSLNKYTPPVDQPWVVNYIEINQPGADLSSIARDVAYARQSLQADMVVLSLHFGNAYQALPGGHIVDNVERIFHECGPDIILGSHPHNIQPMAKHTFICPVTGVEKNGLVVYSLGDFIAYDIFNWCHLPVYLKIVISAGIENGKPKVIVSGVEPVPVYVCGVYSGKRRRDLRLLDARRLMERIGKRQIPSFMRRSNVREFRGLMRFYQACFSFNLKDKRQGKKMVYETLQEPK